MSFLTALRERRLEPLAYLVFFCWARGYIPCARLLADFKEPPAAFPAGGESDPAEA